MKEQGIKLPKHLELANYLGVSVQAVRQYPKKKRFLMLLGIKYLNEIKAENAKKVSSRL